MRFAFQFSSFLVNFNCKKLTHSSLLTYSVCFHTVSWVLWKFSLNLEGSRPDEINEFFSICLIFKAAVGPGLHCVSNRNEYWKQKSNVGVECEADNLAAIC
jgi:hypothetical protein